MNGAQDVPTRPDAIDDEVMARIDADLEQERKISEEQQAWAKAYRGQADEAEARVAELEAVRRFMATRAGMTWAQALAELDAALQEAITKRDEAVAEVKQAQEDYRDLIGFKRVLEREQEAE